MTKPLDYDVAIVGGGPTGLAAGIGFARRGLSTIILEQKPWPVDKACGEGLMPHGLRELELLGANRLLNEAQSHVFDGIEIISMRKKRVRVPFANGKGLGVRRTALSQALFEVASATPHLILSPQTRVLGIERGETLTVLTENGSIRSARLIAADGLHSHIRLELGVQLPISRLKRYGANQHYRIAPWNSCVEVHLTNGLEAYVTPCGREQVGVAFLWHYDRFGPTGRSELVDECLAHFPELRERLHGCEPIGPLQGAGLMHRRVSQTIHGNVVLLGDAAGYYDAITGEGVSIGLTEARLLVEAPNLDAFARGRHALRRKTGLLTRAMLTVARYPALQGPGLAVMQRFPRLFASFMGG